MVFVRLTPTMQLQHYAPYKQNTYEHIMSPMPSYGSCGIDMNEYATQVGSCMVQYDTSIPATLCTYNMYIHLPGLSPGMYCIVWYVSLVETL